jgi:hypothetical protein
MAENSQNVFRLLLWTPPVREASLKEQSLKMDDFLNAYTILSVLFVCAEIVFDKIIVLYLRVIFWVASTNSPLNS